MYEFSGELSQAPHESSQINEAAKQKLNDSPGDEIVDPSVFGITPERAENIHQGFEKRIRAETDIEKVVDGILPSEALFNPDMPLPSIETASGPVEIKRRGKLGRAVVNTLLRFIKLPEAGAFFNPRSRRITIVPELDTFSTLVAVAKGSVRSVVGPSLAHEATHAHQANELKPLDPMETGEIMNHAWYTQKEDPELRFFEAVQLQGRSRDLAIIQESQAYILQYMLTGGNIQPDAITTIKSNIAKVRKGEINTEELEEVKSKGQLEALNQAIEQAKINGVPISRYSENGYASILELVVNKVRTYLPKKDQGNEDYLNRIPSATLQMIRLLDKGVSHRQVADLLRDNFESIHAENEWDESSQKYKFLQRAIEQQPNQEQLDDESLLKKFNKQMENRVMKIRAIATEELTRNKTTDSHYARIVVKESV